MMCLVDAACHPERGVDEAVADLLVTITTKGITITGLKSLCGLLNEAVQRKATANAAHKLVLFWIDKTRRKRWVVNVQVQVLNLLFTMLVNRSSESEAATAKVLDYFKYQFVNIRDHKTPSTPAINVDWRDELRTARQCILTHATVCLAEIKRSAISLRGGSGSGATVSLGRDTAAAENEAGNTPIAMLGRSESMLQQGIAAER